MEKEKKIWKRNGIERENKGRQWEEEDREENKIGEAGEVQKGGKEDRKIGPISRRWLESPGDGLNLRRGTRRDQREEKKSRKGTRTTTRSLEKKGGERRRGRQVADRPRSAGEEEKEWKEGENEEEHKRRKKNWLVFNFYLKPIQKDSKRNTQEKIK